MVKNALSVDILKPARRMTAGLDCTNGGFSSTREECKIVGPKVSGPLEIEEGEDYLVVSQNPRRFNQWEATPKSLIDAGKWAMFGGNFIYTSDSRFPSEQPIKIFDRVEP